MCAKDKQVLRKWSGDAQERASESRTLPCNEGRSSSRFEVRYDWPVRHPGEAKPIALARDLCLAVDPKDARNDVMSQ